MPTPALLLLSTLLTVVASTGARTGEEGWAGVWEARRDFGPEVRGELVVRRDGEGFAASIAGWPAAARVVDGRLELGLPDGRGRFRGRVPGPGQALAGHWLQPVRVENGTAYATPVRLAWDGSGWRGEVRPLEDRMTLFLALEERADGTLGGVLKNLERNGGRGREFERVLIEDEALSFVRADGEVAMAGRLDREGRSLSVELPELGGTFVFRRADAGSAFWARPPDARPYAYRTPAAAQDGWPVATLAEVGMAREPVEELVRELARASWADPTTPSVHAVLVARHGKLVLEEYFHGHGADDLHDTRSAGKSVMATLIGAGIEAGVPLELSSRLVEVLGVEGAGEVDARKAEITLEHLLLMSSGLACDDGDPASPGNEVTLQTQEHQPDWLRYALALPMTHAPGEVAAYCSASPHLAAGMLSAAAGEELPELVHELLARPLGVERYHLNLTPVGRGYGGGGIRLRARDFLKLAQLMLDGGTWHGQRVVSADWAADAVAPLVAIWQEAYGYLWWAIEYPGQDGRVPAFYAGGNGGQYAIGIPALELAVVFFAGDYNGGALMHRTKREYVPRYLLRALAEGAAGD